MRKAVVVGWGPAGYLTALLLSESGVQVTLVGDAVGSWPLWGGAWDFRNRDDHGRWIVSPQVAWQGVGAQHPFARWNPTVWDRAWTVFHDVMMRLSLPFAGGGDQNHWTLTALGRPKRCYWVPAWQWITDEWTPLTVIRFPELLDFPVDLWAETYTRQTGQRLDIRELPKPPGWRADWTSLRWARFFDQPDGQAWLGEIMSRLGSWRYPVVFPGVLGRDDTLSLIRRLESVTGQPVREIPLGPPALGGIRIERILKTGLLARGVIAISGRVVAYSPAGAVTLADGRVLHGEAVVWATGGILGGGITVQVDGQLLDSATGEVLTESGRRRWGPDERVVGRQLAGCNPDRHGDGGAVTWASALWAAASLVNKEEAYVAPFDL